MRERPIIFSGPMVRAILAGRKTVTRRIVKERAGLLVDVTSDGVPVYRSGAPDDGGEPIMCPYGEAGGRLWVRESWGQADSRADEWGYHRGRACKSLPVLYRADNPTHGADDEFWRPSIYMPRWACRLVLGVVSVRVERLHDIDEADAAREGVTPFPADPEGDCWTDGKHRTAFEYLWGSLNRDRAPWASNPFVWRVEFRRTTEPSHAAE
jgi:hypothetical protein